MKKTVLITGAAVGIGRAAALRFAEETQKFNGFEIVVSTHCDRNHIHSHFVMNSVNADTGKKFPFYRISLLLLQFFSLFQLPFLFLFLSS